MYTKEDILTYHCPRWDELPDIDLYMDQVLGFIEKNTAVFAESDEQTVLTKTMINNYVKQKKVKPPVNKKYNKSHIATFMVVGIMKRYLSLAEVGSGILSVRSVYSEKEAYDRFCDALEYSFKCVFNKEVPDYLHNESNAAVSVPEDELYQSMTGALANMLYSRYLLHRFEEKSAEGNK